MAHETLTIETQLEQLKEKLSCMPSGTAVYEYLQYLNRTLGEKDPQFTQEYAPLVQRGRPAGQGVFLSVIIRTMGNRPEMLGETLASLSRQTDMDFEVVLVGHRLGQTGAETVQSVIARQSPAMQQRIRLVRLEEGYRTKPLNVGFAHARGEYIAVLDDDDVVYENWVAEFRAAAGRRPGAMLHAYVHLQDWESRGTESGVQLVPAGQPSEKYCKPFNMVLQLRGNHCPLHGIAFPGYVFRDMGMIFDETLTTGEDWDYIMRVCQLTGVEDIPTPTALYRIWANAANSYSAHQREEWDRNDRYIQEKLMKMPILLPVGSFMTAVDALSELEYLRVHVVPEYERIVTSLRWKLMSAVKLPKFMGSAGRKLLKK